MNTASEKLKNRRDEINAIDSEILDLLNRRAEIALWVGAMKTHNDASLCDHGRERDVLDRLARENRGPLDEQGVRNVFQVVIDESLHLQQRTYQQKLRSTSNVAADLDSAKTVAILGEPGTFSEEAAIALLGSGCKTVSQPTLDDLFRMTKRGYADYILAPLENGLVGPIHRCFDHLVEGSLNIAAEVYLPVSQFLIGCDTATINTIRTVESHPAALGQCEMFFGENPQLVRHEASDTAGSVRRAVESGDPTRAAIGSRRAAEIYHGKIIRENIEDHTDNWTRFVLLSPESNDSAIGDKVSLVVTLKHKPGSLHNALRAFVRRGVNLLKIESRPVKGEPSKFSFYLELQMPAKESEFNAALAEINEHAESVRNLGRYMTLDLTGVQQP
jgi:prephenate dehydratase/chorismate mutase